MNGKCCTESKNGKVLVDQIRPNTKRNCFRTKLVTHIIYNELVDIDEKRQR